MKKKILLCFIIFLSIFFLAGCDNSGNENDNNYQQPEENENVDKNDSDYQYNDEGKKTDDIGWTEEDWKRYYDIIRNSEN